jgi:acyl-CoA oxidase
MLSPFKHNPRLRSYLPVICLVWSDTVLSEKEMATVKRLIDQSEELDNEERAVLHSLVNPSDPPPPSLFKEWLQDIQRVAERLPRSSGLTELSLAMGSTSALSESALTQFSDNLRQFEKELGLIGPEAVYLFYPEGRKTLTQELETKSSFSLDRLNQILNGDQHTFIAKLFTFLDHPDFDFHEELTKEDYRERILIACKRLAAAGYGNIAYPFAFGGKDDMAAYFSVMETMSYKDLSLVVKYGVQFGLFGMSVYFLGTEKHHTRFLVDIGTLNLPGCFAMTETGHGSNVKGIETTATYQPLTRSFIIHTPAISARKEYIGNAASHGHLATVFAKLIIDKKDYGVCAVLVPIRTVDGKAAKGVTIEDCGKKMGLNGIDNGILSFDQVEVPYDNLLDRFCSVSAEGEFQSPITSDNRRFFTMLGTLVGGRIGIPRSGLSAAKTGLTIAVRYGDQRRQFGPEGAPEVPILNYRTHQRRLLPLLAKTYALHFALQHLTNRFLNRKESEMQEIEALAAGLKACATWHTTRTLQECREACGGKGYLTENRIDRLKNDSDIFATFEGDNTVLLQLVAKSRLTEFKQEFSNMNALGLLNYIAGQAKTSLTEMNPIIVRNTDDEHLLDPEFHLNAFRFRERDILTSAARRLKRHLDSGMDSFDAFNVCQHHLVEVGLAYVDRVILEQFQLAIGLVKDRACAHVLSQLCQLYALHQIEEHKGWYLENGYLEGVKSKAIRKMVNQLCWDLRKEAVPLVNSFGIPDHCVRAPIAIGNS